MPKQRITKEIVVHAAFEIARNSGMEQVLVKNIADKIGCSVQPIYSYCKNMDGLRSDVAEQTNIFIRQYMSTCLPVREGRMSVLQKRSPFCLRYSFCTREQEFLH